MMDWVFVTQSRALALVLACGMTLASAGGSDVPMTIEEASKLLGSADDKQALRAEAVLQSAGSDAMGVLDGVIFSNDKEAAERAKQCRRRNLYAVPSGVPSDLVEGVIHFHQQAADRRKEVIEQIAKDPRLGARTLAHLHSRMLERDAADPSINDIRRAFVDRQASDKRLPLDAFDPLLLHVQSRAMVVDSLPCYSDNPSLATYDRWVALDPSIRRWYADDGAAWEARRLTTGKSVPAALAALAEIRDDAVRRAVGRHMLRWANDEINDWRQCPAELRVVALEMADAGNARDAMKIYQVFIGDDPGLAGQLPDGLIGLEVRRRLDAGQVAEACRAAARAEASVEWMKMIGKEAKGKPELFVDGFPEPSGMGARQMAGFLDGLRQPPTRDSQAEWWPWVVHLRAMMARSAAAADWREFMLSEKRFDFLLPLTAANGDFQECVGLAAKDDDPDSRMALARLIRHDPELIGRMAPDASQQRFLRGMIESLLDLPVAGLADLRLIERMRATWSVTLPDLVPDELAGIYLPLAALRQWDTGDRMAAIQQINQVSNQLLAARVIIGLLGGVEPEQLKPLAHAIEFKPQTVKGWLDEASTMSDVDLVKACALLDALDDEGVLQDQQNPVDATELKRNLLDWFHDGRLQRVQHMASASFWFIEPERWQDVCTIAEVLQLVAGPECLQSMAGSLRAQRKPLHRLALMRTLGRNAEVAALVDLLDDTEFKERVMMEQGRYVDAVRAYQKRRKENYNDRKMNAALVFEPDAAGEYAKARKVAWDRRSGVEQAWLPWLTGTGVEELAVGAINGWDGRRVVEHGALEPVMFKAMESRVLAAAHGDAYIDHYTMIHYTSMAPWLPDRERSVAVLRRWAEIPPERMPEIIPHMDFYTSLRVFRALLACGEVNLARQRLHDLLQFKGGADALNCPEAENLCGWEMGRPWKESLAWRMMRLEHPALDDAELFVQMALASQELTLEAGVVRLGELIRRHASAFTHEQQLQLVRSWCDWRMEPVIDKNEHLDQWLEKVRHVITCPLPFQDRRIDVDYQMLGTPDELIQRSTRSERRPLAGGMRAIGEAWHAGRYDEARRKQRQLTMVALLDPELDSRIPLYYRTVRRTRRLGAGNTWHTVVDHMAWHALLNRLPGELLDESLAALCRATQRVSGEPLERLGLIEEALVHQRLAAASRFPEPGRYLSDDDVERVATLRRLECKLAMQRGDRDATLAAFQRFLPKDPYHRSFLLEVRDWFAARGDTAAMQDVDRIVMRFWQDRLLLLPGYQSYQRELSQWLLAVARRAK